MGITDRFYEVAQGRGLPDIPVRASAPRPIGLISMRGPEGRANLVPYSFFNVVCDRLVGKPTCVQVKT